MLLSNGWPGWKVASNWLLAFGLGFAALTAAAGFIDFFGDPLVRGHSDAVKHMVANLTTVALEAVNLLLRLGNPDFILAAGIYISGTVMLILIYSGWKGGCTRLPSRRGSA